MRLPSINGSCDSRCVSDAVLVTGVAMLSFVVAIAWQRLLWWQGLSFVVCIFWIPEQVVDTAIHMHTCASAMLVVNMCIDKIPPMT